MKLYLIIFVALMFSVLIINGQDVICLKNNTKYLVRIVKEYNDSIHFYYLSDPEKTIKNIQRKYLEDYVYEKDNVQFPFDTVTGIITYTEVIQAPSQTKDDIYFAARTFIATTFRSAKDVVQLDDKENGQLIVKATFKTCVGASMTSWGNCDQIVSFTMTLMVKDGRYKYIIDNFYHESHHKDMGNGGHFENAKPACGYMRLSKSKWKDIKEQTQLNVVQLISGLKESIVSNRTPKKDNTW